MDVVGGTCHKCATAGEREPDHVIANNIGIANSEIRVTGFSPPRSGDLRWQPWLPGNVFQSNEIKFELELDLQK